MQISRIEYKASNVNDVKNDQGNVPTKLQVNEPKFVTNHEPMTKILGSDMQSTSDVKIDERQGTLCSSRSKIRNLNELGSSIS